MTEPRDDASCNLPELSPVEGGPERTPLPTETVSLSPSASPLNPSGVSVSCNLPAATRPESPPVSIVLPCVFGDYELLEEVGHGGMGVVYKARQQSLDRLVALKMVRETVRDADQSEKRLWLEARAAAALDHPHIVPVYEVGHFGGYQYFTMAFVEGNTLAERARGRGLPIPEAVRLVLVVAEAIEHVHRHGLIHRDLKPSNILIDRTGRPRVSDFGLAKQVGLDGGLTGSHQLVGTPVYMAPEQALGSSKGKVGPLADIYGLGGLLYFALTGVPAISGESLTEILLKVIQEPPPPVRELQPQVPAELEAICMKCLSKNPQDRYPTAAAVADALRAWSSPSATPSERLAPVEFSASLPDPVAAKLQPPTPSLPIEPPVRRRFPNFRVMDAIVAALIVLAVGLLLVRFLPRSANSQPSGPNRDPVTPVTQSAEFPRGWDILGKPGRLPRDDFMMKVKLLGSKEGARGEHQLEEGQKLAVEIEVQREAYVGIWFVKPDGKVQQLFPNKTEANHHFSAGEKRVIPDETKNVLRARLYNGAERLIVVASSRKWEPIEGALAGPFAILDEKKFRDLVLEEVMGNDAGTKVAEVTIPYRVHRRDE